MQIRISNYRLLLAVSAAAQADNDVRRYLCGVYIWRAPRGGLYYSATNGIAAAIGHDPNGSITGLKGDQQGAFICMLTDTDHCAGAKAVKWGKPKGSQRTNKWSADIIVNAEPAKHDMDWADGTAVIKPGTMHDPNRHWSGHDDPTIQYDDERERHAQALILESQHLTSTGRNCIFPIGSLPLVEGDHDPKMKAKDMTQWSLSLANMKLATTAMTHITSGSGARDMSHALTLTNYCGHWTMCVNRNEQGMECPAREEGQSEAKGELYLLLMPCRGDYNKGRPDWVMQMTADIRDGITPETAELKKAA